MGGKSGSPEFPGAGNGHSERGKAMRCRSQLSAVVLVMVLSGLCAGVSAPAPGAGLEIRVTVDVRDMALNDFVQFLSVKGGFTVDGDSIDGKVCIMADSVRIEDILDALVLTHRFYFEVKGENLTLYRAVKNRARYEAARKRVEAKAERGSVSIAGLEERIAVQAQDISIKDILKFYCKKGHLNFVLNSDDLAGTTSVSYQDTQIRAALNDLAQEVGADLWEVGDLLAVAKIVEE